MKLTKKQRDILQTMLDNIDNEEEDFGELVYEKGRCYLGTDQVDSRVMFSLLRLCAISLDQYSTVGGMERYTINSTGKNLLSEIEKEEVLKIKKKMLKWRDFFGGDIMYTGEIEEATTKKQLSEVMDMYHNHLQDVGNDACRHCEEFKRKIGLNGYY